MATESQTESRPFGEQPGRYRDSLYEFLSRPRVMAAITILPALLLFVFITLGPMLWAIWAGFYEIPVFSPEWEFVLFTNYTELLTEGTFWASVWRSIVFAGGSTALQLVVGTGIALLVNRKFRFHTLVQTIVILPYMIPTAVLGFMALWIGNAQWGVLNGVLLDLGLPRKSGGEVLAELKRDPVLRCIPVVVFSSSSAPGDVSASYELNANAYVAKPATLDGYAKVFAAIDQFWLRTAELPQQAHPSG